MASTQPRGGSPTGGQVARPSPVLELGASSQQPPAGQRSSQTGPLNGRSAPGPVHPDDSGNTRIAPSQDSASGRHGEEALPADRLTTPASAADAAAGPETPGVVPLPPPGGPLELQSTLELLDRAKGGDELARDVVFRRCVRGLKRFAAGRLPVRCRGMNDTEDLVQDTVASALRRLDRFEIRHEGALLAYLRQAVLNRIIDEVRKKNRRPLAVTLPEDYVDGGTSPLERVIGLQNVERYEAALRQLRPRDREAIVMRLEQQIGYDLMAKHLGMPSPNAARVAVKRALFRLAQKMAEHSSSVGPKRGGAEDAPDQDATHDDSTEATS